MKDIHKSDEIFLTDARAAALIKTPLIGRLSLYLLMLTIITVITWAYFAVLDEQTNATGRVVPTSSNQMIQSLEGGILDAIYVVQGEIVEKNQPIIGIDNTIFLAELKEAQAKHRALLSTIARLNSELQGLDSITFPKSIDKYPEIIDRQNKLFKSRRSKYKLEYKEKNDNYKALVKEYNITKPLVDKGLIANLELLRLERQVLEAKAKVDQHEDAYHEQVLRELSQARPEINSLEEKLIALQDKVSRTTLVSPMRAQVKQIMINTIGGVIAPGMEIMELVPLEEKLLIEADIKPSDIGYLHPDQDVEIKVTAYDYSIHGGLKGKLNYISADTIKNEKGEALYQVQVTTKKNYLESKTGAILPIIPGMTVTAHILTGKKTVLEYIMKPIKKGLSTAMTER